MELVEAEVRKMWTSICLKCKNLERVFIDGTIHCTIYKHTYLALACKNYMPVELEKSSEEVKEAIKKFFENIAKQKDESQSTQNT